MVEGGKERGREGASEGGREGGRMRTHTNESRPSFVLGKSLTTDLYSHLVDSVLLKFPEWVCEC